MSGHLRWPANRRPRLPIAVPYGLLYLAHDLGDAVLLGPRLVGALAKTLRIQLHEIGPGSPQPLEVVLADPWA